MNDDDSTVRLELGVATDAAGYLRHECPSCMLEFKLKGDEARFTDALGWWMSKAASHGGAPDRSARAEPQRARIACPYCAQQSPAQDYLHSEFRAFVRHVALREVVEPMLFGMFENMERAFSGLRSGPVTVRVEHSSRARSPRPLSGPEADDMVRVACTQCGEHFKLFAGWRGAVKCPSCSSDLRLG